MKWGSIARSVLIVGVVASLASVPSERGASTLAGDIKWTAPAARRVSGTVPPTDRKWSYNTNSDVSDRGRFAIFNWSFRDGPSQLFLRDMSKDKLFWLDKPRVAAGPSTTGRGLNVASEGPTISASGRYVAFSSRSSALVNKDDNRKTDVFVYDRIQREVSMVSVTPDGSPADAHSGSSYISPNGRYVAFSSKAQDLTDEDVQAGAHVYVRDLILGETRVGSISHDGRTRRRSFYGSVSNDGTRVAFLSDAIGVVPNDTNRATDAFVHDFDTGDTTRVSVGPGGSQMEAFEYEESASSYRDGAEQLMLSGNGKVAVFRAHSNGLVAEDDNNNLDIFAHDLTTSTTERVSEPSGGGDAYPTEDDRDCGHNGQCFFSIGSSYPSISRDGRFVYFLSGSSELVGSERDTPYGTDEDVFVHDRVEDITILVNRRHDGTPSKENNLYRGAISHDGRWVTYSSDGRYISSKHDDRGGGDVYLQKLPAPAP